MTISKLKTQLENVEFFLDLEIKAFESNKYFFY